MNMYFILFKQFFSTVTMIKFIYVSFFIIFFLYLQWYGKPHAAVELQLEAVYGLPEVRAL